MNKTLTETDSNDFRAATRQTLGSQKMLVLTEISPTSRGRYAMSGELPLDQNSSITPQQYKASDKVSSTEVGHILFADIRVIYMKQLEIGMDS
jgi:hypothetical protein